MLYFENNWLHIFLHVFKYVLICCGLLSNNIIINAMINYNFIGNNVFKLIILNYKQLGRYIRNIYEKIRFELLPSLSFSQILLSIYYQ